MRAMALLTCLLLCCGCGKKERTVAAAADPSALFTQFDAAMRGRQYAQVAAMVDFPAAAAAANEDWDEIPTSQQGLITDKMRESTVAALTSMQYPAGGLKPSAAQVSADTATISSDDGSVTLVLRKGAEGWKIVAGLPGMTPG